MNPLLKQGLAAHEQGKLAQAEQCYRGVLQQEANNPDALHLLGVIAFQARRFEPAADLISRAITINPNAAMYQNNLGNVLRALLLARGDPERPGHEPGGGDERGGVVHAACALIAR